MENCSVGYYSSNHGGNKSLTRPSSFADLSPNKVISPPTGSQFWDFYQCVFIRAVKSRTEPL